MLAFSLRLKRRWKKEPTIATIPSLSTNSLKSCQNSTVNISPGTLPPEKQSWTTRLHFVNSSPSSSSATSLLLFKAFWRESEARWWMYVEPERRFTEEMGYEERLK
jgi:hypothetical protein